MVNTSSNGIKYCINLPIVFSRCHQTTSGKGWLQKRSRSGLECLILDSVVKACLVVVILFHIRKGDLSKKLDNES